MNREIKFRQWIAKVNEFHYFGYKDGHLIGPAEASLSRNPIMEFTGLQDENGVDVYEGDVCRAYGGECYVGRHEIDLIGVVRYVPGGMYLVDPKNQVHYDFGNIEHIRVLGNIYENPEIQYKNKER